MSSYIALYRKWRPQVFEDVVGQEHITDVLRGEIIRGSVSHAYLFCGSRGTGKTTCAKILARAVSCENPKDGDPCGECENCKKALESFDIAEIDAASNNGVDNIRELREEVLYPPSELKRRVYIIDEVHMLSTGAFNALLKTLEEPPEHAMFILATTELNKIPATILSRCKRFDFHRITPDNIAKRLKTICEAENIPMSDGAVMLIARLAGGAMRDALSMLELFVGKTETVTEEMCAKAMGVVGRGPVMKLLSCVADNDCAGALSVISEAFDGSKDMGVLLSECADAVRDMLMIKYTSNPEKFVEGSADVLASLTECAKKFTRERLIYSTEILDDAQGRITKTGFSGRAVLETCVIRLCDVKLWTLPESLNTRIAQLEDKIASGNIVVSAGAPSAQPVKEAPAPKPAAEPSKAPAPTYAVDNEHTDIPPEIPDDIPPFDFDMENAVPVKEAKANPDDGLIPDLPENKAVPEEASSDITADSAVENAPPAPAPKPSSDGGAGREALSAYPDILEDIKEKNKLLSSLLTESRAYRIGNDTVVVALPSFASVMVKNDARKMESLESCIKKYVGDVNVKLEILGTKKDEEWSL
ncbi:MAG: DNA polymerase III subunit gamma/tau [Clostridia bacterium]|nr:DNA polymerase III subunit gamma/tau [Clostridia bacterium]